MRQYIKSYPDFPVNGVDFKCTASLCASQEGFALANNFIYSNLLKYCPVDKVIGIDARGFIFASVFCHRTRGPLVLARKPGKLPGSIKSASYELEYGKNTLELQSDSIQPGDKCIVIDDLVATGGSMMATKRLVEKTGATALGGVTIVNLKYLNNNMERFPIITTYEVTE